MCPSTTPGAPYSAVPFSRIDTQSCLVFPWGMLRLTCAFAGGFSSPMLLCQVRESILLGLIGHLLQPFLLLFLPVSPFFPSLRVSRFICLFVLAPGPVITMGPFNLPLDELSSFSGSTHSMSAHGWSLSFVLPTSKLSVHHPSPSCFFCLPLRSSCSCQHTEMAGLRLHPLC